MGAKPCAPGWWTWAGSEGSGPGWERLGNWRAARAGACPEISWGDLQDGMAAPPSSVQSPLSDTWGDRCLQDIRNAIELPLPATR